MIELLQIMLEVTCLYQILVQLATRSVEAFTVRVVSFNRIEDRNVASIHWFCEHIFLQYS